MEEEFTMPAMGDLFSDEEEEHDFEEDYKAPVKITRPSSIKNSGVEELEFLIEDSFNGEEFSVFRKNRFLAKVENGYVKDSFDMVEKELEFWSEYINENNIQIRSKEFFLTKIEFLLCKILEC